MKEYRLKEVTEGIYDGPHATPARSEEGAIFLGIKNVTEDGCIDLTDTYFISETDLKKWTRRVRPQYGDLVFSYEATLHRYALIPKDFYGCLGRRMALIRPKKEFLDIKYLFYLFLSPAWKSFIEANQISGATVDRIPLAKFPDYLISLPPLPTQRRIASILSAYDDLIEVNNQRIKLLEETARQLYKEWFVRMRFPGYKKAKFVKGVPEGWEVGNVGSLYDVKSGFAFKSETLGEVGYPIIKITNIQNGNIELDECERYNGDLSKRIEKFELFEGDLLIAMTGAQIGKVGLMGTTAERFFLNQRVGKFFPKKNYLVNNAFLFLFSNTENFQSTIENFGMGAAQPNISGEQIERISCLIPSDDLLKQFTSICEPFFKQISVLKQQNTHLRQIRDRLLPRLVSDKLAVKPLAAYPENEMLTMAAEG